MVSDILDNYRNTKQLYKEIKAYMERKKVTKDTPFPIITMYVNARIKYYKGIEDSPNIMYPKQKIIRMIFYYLDSIGYKY